MADRRSTAKPFQTRSSIRSSIRSSNSNVFSDDFVLEEYEPVADGGPPTSASMTMPPPSPLPQRSLSIQQTGESSQGSIRRSGLSQRSTGQDSSTSRFDDAASRLSPSDQAHTISNPHRSFRTNSTVGLPRAQSPYQGPTGPSQPYSMYSQDVSIGRSPSAATTSTIRPPERAYSGPAGPTQPYGMYSQNTMSEDDQEVIGVVPPMPGLAGLAQPQAQAIRRLGPDGEDADDLIGPDGYTEQLPPYSRYANGIPPKVDSGTASFISHPPAQVLPQGPQEMTQAGPSEYYRPEPIEVVPGSPAIVNPFEDSSATLSTMTAADSLPSEKGSFKERIKRSGNKRVCFGLLPCWALAFVVVVLFAAILLGGVIGGVVAHHAISRHSEMSNNQSQQVNSPITITTTTLADASPITSIPSNLPALPTGAFNFALSNPVQGENSNSCLSVAQSSAWDCSTGAGLKIGITMQGPHQPLLTITYNMPSDPQTPNAPNPQIRYGAQPPTLLGQVNLNLMRDQVEWNNGPAYFFQQVYNKTVILRAQDLSGSYRRTKRSGQDWSWLIERGQSDWVLNQFVNIAEKPWYCFWNGTFLEGFIYVTQNEGSPVASNAAAASSFASYSSSSSAPPIPQRKRQAGVVTSGTTYPKVIKIEERRPLRNPPQPYCQQMQILNTGEPAPYAPNGHPVIVNLIETEPLPLQQQQLDRPPPAFTTSYKEKRQTSIRSKCKCEWRN